MSDRRGRIRRRGGKQVADDTWLDDDTPDTGEDQEGLTLSQSQLRKLAVVGVVVALLAWATFMRLRNDDGDEQAAADDRQEEAVEPAVTTTFATGDALTPVEPTCPEPPYEERALQFAIEPGETPPMCIEDGVTYVATVQTTRGDFEITLDAESAPIAVNNFVFLARWRFYDGVGFHRVVPDFLLQTGDPIGPTPGMGDPGYTIPDEPPSEEPFYPALSVGMTRAPDEPNTNGSRFFIVVGRAGEAQDPRYTRFGHITNGEEVIREIEATGNPDGTVPADLTLVETITIEERRS